MTGQRYWAGQRARERTTWAPRAAPRPIWPSKGEEKRISPPSPCSWALGWLGCFHHLLLVKLRFSEGSFSFLWFATFDISMMCVQITELVSATVVEFRAVGENASTQPEVDELVWPRRRGRNGAPALRLHAGRKSVLPNRNLKFIFETDASFVGAPCVEIVLRRIFCLDILDSSPGVLGKIWKIDLRWSRVYSV